MLIKSSSMKALFPAIHFFLMLSLLLVITACSNDDTTDGGSSTTTSIMQTLAMEEDVSDFFEALTRTNLDELVSTDESYTILAPDNNAMSDYLQVFGFSGIDAIPLEDLKQLIANHIIKGVLTADDLKTKGNGYVTTEATINNKPVSMYVNVTGSVGFNGVALNIADLTASNGVIHKVVGVLPLPTMATFVQNDPSFFTLFEAIKKVDAENDAGLIAAFANPQGAYTVFMPDNEALTATVSSLGFASLNEVPATTLENILKTHVIGSVIRAENLQNTTVATLNTTNDLTIFTATPSVQGPGNTAPIAIDVTNITAINGVGHAIMGVILPKL